MMSSEMLIFQVRSKLQELHVDVHNQFYLAVQMIQMGDEHNHVLNV